MFCRAIQKLPRPRETIADAARGEGIGISAAKGGGWETGKPLKGPGNRSLGRLLVEMRNFAQQYPWVSKNA